VQGGDYRGKAATVVEMKSTQTSAYVKTISRHWASGDLLPECTMEQWIELQGPIVQVRYKFTYNGDKSHQPRHQETPAVFVSPQLSTLVTYTGDQPWTNAPLERFTPGWPNQSITLSESWAAYVDGTGNGIGVYVPGVAEATCYRFRGGAGSDCSYVAPLRTFALTPGLSFTYKAYLTLGDADTMRQRFSQLRSGEK
jgi:hypothetical protein